MAQLLRHTAFDGTRDQIDGESVCLLTSPGQ